jgi:hypothetical protein
VSFRKVNKTHETDALSRDYRMTSGLTLPEQDSALELDGIATV